MNPEELHREVAAIPWWHSIDLGHGIRTPGRDDSPGKLRRLHLPGDLRGKSVLDVGAWDGFFSFEAERRGACRVLAVDSMVWQEGRGGSKRGFELAHRALGSRVESRTLEVLDLSPEAVGTFDLVLFLGVLYHMRHPLLALERVFSVTKDLLILETHVDLLDRAAPAMAYYPGDELNGDRTNWWGPNPAAVEAMLRTAGFRTVTRIDPLPSLPKRLARALQGDALSRGRAVFHAWR